MGPKRNTRIKSKETAIESLDDESMELEGLEGKGLTQCNDCKSAGRKKFFFKHIDIHKSRFHDDQKNYWCELCPMGFYKKESYVRHIGRKHSETGDIITNVEGVPHIRTTFGNYHCLILISNELLN